MKALICDICGRQENSSVMSQGLNLYWAGTKICGQLYPEELCDSCADLVSGYLANLKTEITRFNQDRKQEQERQRIDEERNKIRAMREEAIREEALNTNEYPDMDRNKD